MSADSAVKKKLDTWVTKLGKLAKEYKIRAKSTCCYCGENAAEDSQCIICDGAICDWEMAHAVWETNVTISAEKPEEYEQNMIYVEQLFSKAMDIDAERNNALLVMDFSLFLWKQKGDLMA
eukprot:6770932-Pyramimonas_sp.AAC.1